MAVGVEKEGKGEGGERVEKGVRKGVRKGV